MVGEEGKGRSQEGGKRLAPPRPQVAANAERLLEGAGPGGGACAHGPPPYPPATTPRALPPGPELITRDARRNPPCSADCCSRPLPGKEVPRLPTPQTKSPSARVPPRTSGGGGGDCAPPAPSLDPDRREGDRRPDSCCSNAGRPDSWLPGDGTGRESAVGGAAGEQVRLLVAFAGRGPFWIFFLL